MAHLTLNELEDAVQAVEPAAVLLSPRILRRIIRLDCRLAAFGYSVPHDRSYVIVRERLFDYVSRFELELDADRELPDTVLLLRRPDEDELETRPASDLLYEYWRLLFHARVHVELQRRISAGNLTDDDVLNRLRRIGSPEFSEVRAVLQRDDLILPPRTDLTTYVEFASVFLELLHFAPGQLAWNFAALRDAARVAGVLSEDVDHAALFEATRLAGAESPAVWGSEEDSADEPAESAASVTVDPLQPSPPSYWRLIARAEKAGAVGNTAKAAVLRSKAARVALPDRTQEMKALAIAEVDRFARRLQSALGLTDQETEAWATALAPLLQHTDRGYRTVESRLLYDLQKVCVEYERGVFTLDFWGWCRSLGRVRMRRPLPLLRGVLVAKHLQSAARKLTTSQLTGPARGQLSRLIDAALADAQQRSRDRVRPAITKTLFAEGLQPQNVPERIAFLKIVEELLDRIVRHGYLNFGDIRDALSQNNLKLPDLTRFRELLTGDTLLRIDRRLAVALDGVYHRGPVYLRGSHRLSALAFGTPSGRFVTRFVALPFGGAFLLERFTRHIVEWVVEWVSGRSPEIPAETPLEGPPLLEAAQVLLLGIFLLLLLENAVFRRWFLAGLSKLGQFARRLFYDLPVLILRLPWVRWLLDSPLYAVFIAYVFKPFVLTCCFLFPFALSFGRIDWTTASIAFLVVNLMLNSPMGRYADEWLTEQIVRGLRGLHIHVLAAGLRLIIDFFQWLLQAVEQLLYTVDEWLLFRRGEGRLVLAAKGLLGAVWSSISYVVRLSITLLIEPQVNPIKHFPVVTVSHKIIWPLSSIYLAQLLADPLGHVWANTIAVATGFLLPGVFGFLAWELKENWRLYAANRSENLQPVRIGRHGETMLQLLRLGFHSGTVPRLFGKLRAAGRRAIRTGDWKAVHKHGESLQHVEDSVRDFVERELLSLLSECRQWQRHPLEIAAIRLAANRATVQLRHPGLPGDPVELGFQERGGWLMADMPQRGWLDAAPYDQRTTFLDAVNGFYKCAGVDLVWDRVVPRLGADIYWYDINRDGILVWRDARYSSAGMYKLRDTGATVALTTPLSFVRELPEATVDEILFSRRPLPWDEWVAMWQPRQAASND